MLKSQNSASLEPAPSPARVPAPAPRPHGGRSLDAPMLDRMQSRFGQDFSGIRIHTGDDAQRSAAALGARAYTRGADLVFAQGQYSPATPGGRRLIAHELAHVAQLRRGPADAGKGGDSEARAETAAQEAAQGQAVDRSALGGAAPGIHCDGDGKDQKKKAGDGPAKIDPQPYFLPLPLLPRPQLEPPSLLAPPQRQPLIPIPDFSTRAGAGAVAPQGQQLPLPRPPLSGPTLRPDAGGPLLPTAQPFTMPPMPAAKGAGAAPDLPSRLALKDVGPFSIGLRLSLPGPSSEIEGTPPERRKQSPFAVPGSGPSAMSVADYQFELLHLSMTGKVPTGFDAIDKGELAKILFSIASTHIAPGFFKSLASKVAGKPGTGYQLDLSLTGDFKGGGFVFTMPLDKPPVLAPRSAP